MWRAATVTPCPAPSKEAVILYVQSFSGCLETLDIESVLHRQGSTLAGFIGSGQTTQIFLLNLLCY